MRQVCKIGVSTADRREAATYCSTRDYTVLISRCSDFVSTAAEAASSLRRALGGVELPWASTSIPNEPPTRKHHDNDAKGKFPLMFDSQIVR